MKRIYESIISDHFSNNDEMLFISGARQVGKTTTADTLSSDLYLSWDIQEDRASILSGQRKLVDLLGAIPGRTVIFDELHKYPDWKNFIKGFYDLQKKLKWRIIVTGSARLDTFRKGGDSILGRYFHLQMFPLSPAELMRTTFTEKVINPSARIDDDQWEALLTFGGFPQPFLKANKRFLLRWSRSRRERLFNEDIRTLGRAYEISKIELLSELIQLNATSALNYSSLSRKIRTSVDSVLRWIELLKQLSFCFTLRPWSKNISRSIAKEPKIYLQDWSGITDTGKRNENFMACALLKAVQGWNDTGLGNYALNYIRTKDKREVDFIITDDGKPWVLIECKTSETSLSPQLRYFQHITGATHAFQAVINLPYQELDCFSITVPSVVSARTLLSQLL